MTSLNYYLPFYKKKDFLKRPCFDKQNQINSIKINEKVITVYFLCMMYCWEFWEFLFWTKINVLKILLDFFGHYQRTISCIFVEII